MTEEKEKIENNLSSLIGILSTNKINSYNRGGKRKKKNPKESTASQNIRIIVFLESPLSETVTGNPPYLPKMPSNTVLISGPAVEAAQILIWSYSCVFLPPMSTVIRTSAFSFVGIHNILLYIP